MAIEKVINVVVNEVGVKPAIDDVEKLGKTIDNVESSNSSFGKSFKDSALSILENGGAMGILNEVTGGYAMTVKDAVEASGLFTKGTTISTLAQKVYTAVVGTSTGALKAFKIALATTGIGVLIVALGYFISKMSDATEATEEEVKAQELLKIQIEKVGEALKDQIGLINSYTQVRKLHAEIAGKSTKDLLQIDLEASEERIEALHAEQKALNELLGDKNTSLEQSKEINKKLLENNRAIINEINGQEVLRLQFQKEQADARRDAEKDAEEKRLEAIKKANDERLAAAREYQKQLAADLLAFNQLLLDTSNAERDNDIAAQNEKNELLRTLQGESALQALDQELENARVILDAAKASYEERFLVEQEFEQRRRDIEEENEIARIEKISENFDNEKLSFDTRFELLDQQNKMILESDALTEAERTRLLAENVDARNALSDAEFEHQKKLAGAATSLLNQASELAGKKTAAGKVLAVASATISTYVSAVDAYKGMVSAIPGPVGIAAGAVAAAFSIASGFATVKKILSVKTPGGGGGDSGGGGGGAPAPPSFNIVGQSNNNQLAQSIAGANAQQQQPTKAYVVSSEVTSQQALDRDIESTATFN